MDIAEKVEARERTLVRLAKQRESGKLVGAAHHSVIAVTETLSIVLAKTESCESGLVELRELDAPNLLSQATELHVLLQNEIVEGSKPDSAIGGVYHLLVLVHVAWLLDELDSGSRLLDIAVDQMKRGYGTPLWDQYTEAMFRFNRGEAFDPEEPKKLRGLEQYWFQHTVLMGDIPSGREPAESRDRVAQGFKTRNSDKRLQSDSEEIEGTGTAPVNWDFRAESILRLAAKKYDLAI